MVFFINLSTEKFHGFNAKVLPTCWIYKPGFYFFSLYKIKTSKQLSLFIPQTISYMKG